MVLVVEDNDDVRKFVTAVLEMNGYDVIETSGGRDALEIAAEFDGPIDLLLTDVMMPDLTGPEVAAELGPLRPAMKTLYISGHSNNEIARRGILNAHVAYLAKPFSSRELIK